MTKNKNLEKFKIRDEIKLYKIQVYRIITKFCLYLFYFLLAISFLFDRLIFFITIIPLIMIFAFSGIQYLRLLISFQNEVKIRVNKLKNEIKNRETSSTFSPEFQISFIEKLLFPSESKLNRMEIFIESVFELEEIEREKILSFFQEFFFEKINESLQILLYYVDMEEYELIKFLSIKKKQHFLFWSIIQVIIVSLSLILGFLFAFTKLLPSPNFFIGMIIFFNLLFRDIKTTVNKKFQNGFNRYHKNRKIFIEYLTILNLLCNNHYIRSLNQFKDFIPLLNVTNLKIKNFKEIIKPYYSYIQKYEIIGLLGLLITIIIVFFQDIPNDTPSSLIEFNVPKIILFLLIVYFFIILPIRQYRKLLTINILKDEKGKKLKKNLEYLTESQYTFILASQNSN